MGAADIESIKNENKIVISYLSIGEAEDYRFYWNNSWLLHLPEWLDAENLDWPGNYKVKYWMPGWQQYIYAYLDIIIAQGSAQFRKSWTMLDKFHSRKVQKFAFLDV